MRDAVEHEAKIVEAGPDVVVNFGSLSSSVACSTFVIAWSALFAMTPSVAVKSIGSEVWSIPPAASGAPCPSVESSTILSPSSPLPRICAFVSARTRGDSSRATCELHVDAAVAHVGGVRDGLHAPDVEPPMRTGDPGLSPATSSNAATYSTFAVPELLGVADEERRDAGEDEPREDEEPDLDLTFVMCNARDTRGTLKTTKERGDVLALRRAPFDEVANVRVAGLLETRPSCRRR